MIVSRDAGVRDAPGDAARVVRVDHRHQPPPEAQAPLTLPRSGTTVARNARSLSCPCNACRPVTAATMVKEPSNLFGTRGQAVRVACARDVPRTPKAWSRGGWDVGRGSLARAGASSCSAPGGREPHGTRHRSGAGRPRDGHPWSRQPPGRGGGSGCGTIGGSHRARHDPCGRARPPAPRPGW